MYEEYVSFRFFLSPSAGVFVLLAVFFAAFFFSVDLAGAFAAVDAGAGAFPAVEAG